MKGNGTDVCFNNFILAIWVQQNRQKENPNSCLLFVYHNECYIFFGNTKWPSDQEFKTTHQFY